MTYYVCKWCGCRVDGDRPLCDDCFAALNAPPEDVPDAVKNRKRNVKREVE
jgi:hypothetical protein